MRGGRVATPASCRKVRRRAALLLLHVRMAAPKLTLYYLQGGRVDKFTVSLPLSSLLQVQPLCLHARRRRRRYRWSRCGGGACRHLSSTLLYPYAVACRCALPSCREKLHSNCLPLLRLLQGELSSCVCSGAAH